MPTITFDMNGGTGTPISPTTAPLYEAFPIPNVDWTKDMCFLSEWTATGATIIGNYIYPFADDVVLKASWSFVDIISYDYNGVGTLFEEKKTRGSTFILRGCPYTKEHYIFEAWMDKATGKLFQPGFSLIIPKSLNGRIDLVAIWVPAVE